jgi:hypothetical protein
MRVFVCSPYSGKIVENIEMAKRFVLEEALCGNYPYAPHLYLPLVLDDSKPEERALGIETGLSFLAVCDAVHVYLLDGRLSDGMRAEIKRAKELSIPIRYFYASKLERTREIHDV